MTLLRAQTPPASPQQTFRVGTDLVMVDVSVKSGDRVLTGLGPDDFVLTDNGVRQRIESVEATAVPIDLTLVVDLSGNPARPWTARVDPAKVAASVEREAQEVVRILRPADRVRLLAIDRYVHEVWPLDGPPALRPIKRLESDGLGSVYDTLAAALMHPVEPARRHVVIARTKGVDTMSAISARALRAIADRSDALFHLVIMEASLENDRAISAFQSNFIGFVEATNRSWVPHRRQLVDSFIPHAVLSDGLALKAGLETTGGRWHQATGVSVPSLTGTFREAFENFRQGYMLRYTPQGVTRTGWHAINVTVPRAKGFTVRARKGYGIEDSTPAPAATPVPAAPRTLAELTRAYEAGAFVNVVSALRQATDPLRLMRDFEEEGNPWPAAPRREAAFAIDLAEASVFSPRADTRDRAIRLLERFTRLVRHPLEPDEFERQWHYAVVTLLQGTIRPADIDTFANRALARFPNEPRFLLARAIAADQRSTVTGASRAGTASAQSALQDLGQQYEALVTDPDVGAEARIRLAWVLHRMGRHSDGLAQINEAEVDPADGSLRYLRHLLSGHLLAALARPDDAAVAYRTARAIVPTAQSAQVALMNGLLGRGDRTGAQAIAERIQTERSDDLDPWWMYWQGQYRLYGQAMARVREAGR
jgi:VWFA-related protein